VATGGETAPLVGRGRRIPGRVRGRLRFGRHGRGADRRRHEYDREEEANGERGTAAHTPRFEIPQIKSRDAVLSLDTVVRTGASVDRIQPVIGTFLTPRKSEQELTLRSVAHPNQPGELRANCVKPPIPRVSGVANDGNDAPFGVQSALSFRSKWWFYCVDDK
jgi:hypothetical protein